MVPRLWHRVLVTFCSYLFRVFLADFSLQFNEQQRLSEAQEEIYVSVELLQMFSIKNKELCRYFRSTTRYGNVNISD